MHTALQAQRHQDWREDLPSRNELRQLELVNPTHADILHDVRVRRLAHKVNTEQVIAQHISNWMDPATETALDAAMHARLRKSLGDRDDLRGSPWFDNSRWELPRELDAV